MNFNCVTWHFLKTRNINGIFHFKYSNKKYKFFFSSLLSSSHAFSMASLSLSLNSMKSTNIQIGRHNIVIAEVTLQMFCLENMPVSYIEKDNRRHMYR
ncbi:hypothetical protein T03_6688 [Trichinella britovi]|uniref:Uncharacterized protein n=1 Tax=Trichinella britovi TaxID=45882 RepID=A0A0V1D165_TRIBR|nr:hypothetical protein T03_6688 [Trichinella britovi]